MEIHDGGPFVFIGLRWGLKTQNHGVPGRIDCRGKGGLLKANRYLQITQAVPNFMYVTAQSAYLFFEVNAEGRMPEGSADTPGQWWPVQSCAICDHGIGGRHIRGIQPAVP